MTKKAERYAAHYKIPVAEVEKIRKRTSPVYHTQGFAHPDIPVVIYEGSFHTDLYHWGLIPYWVKNAGDATRLSNQTLNSRSEEMYNKPSFRLSARKKRCLVMVDGFFEHHWKNGKSYPYLIQRKDGEPFSLAGLWDTWKDSEHQVSVHSVSIVTTRANALMTRIHNNPKASEGPRMPVIIAAEEYTAYLTAADDPVGKKQVMEMTVPFDEDLLMAHPVSRLRGKEYVGNTPQIWENHPYPELQD